VTIDPAVGGTVRESGPPAVVGVGIDLVELDRFTGVLERRARFVERVFTAGERDVRGRRGGSRVRGLAARFAAKEAVMKALGAGIGQIRFADVEITRAAGGAPSVVLHGSAAAHAAAMGVTAWHLSMTHTDRTAAAVAVASSGGGRATRAEGGGPVPTARAVR